MTTKRSSRPSVSGFADTANGNPFAVFEIIAESRRLRDRLTDPELLDRVRSIELHADGMIKTILGTADLSTLELPGSVIEQIISLLRENRNGPPG
ncbi:MAG: hypothetical protein EBZ36_00315 [Acidobacteria bacterium]|jgi:hypothetical protein|nr:hypothetical protein [Acidobacteriota bacterium]